MTFITSSPVLCFVTSYPSFVEVICVLICQVLEFHDFIHHLLIRVVVMYNHITCTHRRGLSTAVRQRWALHLYG